MPDPSKSNNMPKPSFSAAGGGLLFIVCCRWWISNSCPSWQPHLQILQIQNLKHNKPDAQGKNHHQWLSSSSAKLEINDIGKHFFFLRTVNGRKPFRTTNETMGGHCLLVSMGESSKRGWNHQKRGLLMCRMLSIHSMTG